MGVRLSKFWKRFFYSAAAFLGISLTPSCDLGEILPPYIPIIDEPVMYGMPPASCHHTLSGSVTRNGELVSGVKVKLVINDEVIEEVETNEYGNYTINYFEEAEDGLPVKLIFNDTIIKEATLEDDEYEIIINVELTEEENND
ncbi:MAG: hypothetical protein K5829_06040 [Treponema sp.]|nr:hypothetical protein [Treponema sp.]